MTTGDDNDDDDDDEWMNVWMGVNNEIKKDKIENAHVLENWIHWHERFYVVSASSCRLTTCCLT